MPVMNEITNEVPYRIAADVIACDTRKMLEMTTREVGPNRRSMYS